MCGLIPGGIDNVPRHDIVDMRLVGVGWDRICHCVGGGWLGALLPFGFPVLVLCSELVLRIGRRLASDLDCLLPVAVPGGLVGLCCGCFVCPGRGLVEVVLRGDGVLLLLSCVDLLLVVWFGCVWVVLVPVCERPVVGWRDR